MFETHLNDIPQMQIARLRSIEREDWYSFRGQTCLLTLRRIRQVVFLPQEN
jgi:hypothetical protein